MVCSSGLGTISVDAVAVKEHTGLAGRENPSELAEGLGHDSVGAGPFLEGLRGGPGAGEMALDGGKVPEAC